MFKVRTMRPTDVQPVLEIDQACRLRPDSAEQLLVYLGDSRGTDAVVATDDGYVVGYALTDRDAPNNVLLVYRLQVRPDYRRRGVASEIVDKLVERAEALNKSGIIAVVDEMDQESTQFWVDLGATSSLVKECFGERDGILFELSLDEEA